HTRKPIGAPRRMPPIPSLQLDHDTERSLAGALYNYVWELMELPTRDTDDDDRMLHAAHASRHHWGVVGEARHRARGEWLCSRVYVLLGRGEPALHHAERCLEICTAHPDELDDWDVPYAHEALSRAHALVGDDGKAARHRRTAGELAEAVSDVQDKEQL